MAATRTRNTFWTRITEVAVGFSADAASDNRECGRLGGACHDHDIDFMGTGHLAVLDRGRTA